MIKKLLYIAALLTMASCSDDMIDSPGGFLPSDGELNLSFSVPEMSDPNTRANEDGLEDVQMLVFSDGVLKQIEPLGAVIPEAKFPVTIKKELRLKGSLDFVFVSASPVSFAEGTSLTDVLGMNVRQVTTTITTKNGETDDYMVMTGKSDLQSLLLMNSVSMTRNAAKVTVKDKNTKAAYPFEIYGTADESPLFAGTDDSKGNSSGAGAYHALKTDDRYVHPTLNTGNSENAAFIIVQVPYNGTQYYYRLNIHDDKGTTLDLHANYHYEVLILDTPRSAGYLTQEEAAKNPVSQSEGWYIIHDHAPVIYNMVSDGTRELGVSHEVRNEKTAAGTPAELFVKVYSKTDSSEETPFSASNISFGDSWASVKSITKIESGSELGTNGGGLINEEKNEDGSGDKIDKPDYNTKGTVYKVIVEFGDTKNTGLLETECSVTWKGLTRIVPVIWDRNFDASQLYKSVKMTMKEGETEKFSTNDYFGFIRGKYDDTGKLTDFPNVWGATAAANNGEARDLGLHFPIQYGDPTLWTYEYEIELNDLGEKQTYTWSYEFKGDAAVNGEVHLTNLDASMTLTEKGPHFKLTRRGEGWEYGVGELVIKVNGNQYPIPLYHTGFLHQDNLTTTEKGIGLAKLAETEGKRDWTYYEVVSIGAAHWLDRNLCAHSSEMYVETSEGKVYAGNPEAAGGYYRVAGYVKHGKPQMEESICPPGYSFPTQHNFNEMRSSSYFYTGQVGSYYTASYTADIYDGGEKRKTVYFPKALYLDGNNARAGESRAGYYWSSTAASGTEKEEIGAWLKCFNLSGEASSFINGEVYCSSESTSGNSTRTGEVNGFAMPVRCVNKGNSDSDTPEATSFFVKGVTHVYFYTLEGEKPKAVTTWPGTSIGSFNTVTKPFNVLYESSVNTPDKLYVIFNYVDENGKVHSMSKNMTDLAHARFTDDVSPEQLQGWKVKGDNAPDYPRYGSATTITNVIDVYQADPEGTKTKYYWTCDFFSDKGGFGTAEGDIDVPIYRLYWHWSYGGFTGMNLFFGKANDTMSDIAYKSNMYSEDEWNIFGWDEPYRYQDITLFDWPSVCQKLCVQGRFDNNGWSDKQPYVLKSDFKKTTIGGNPNYYCYTVDGDVADSGAHVNGYSGKPNDK